MPPSVDLPDALRAPLRALARRIRVQRALEAWVIGAFAGVASAVTILALAKTGAIDSAQAWRFGAGALALPFLAALLSAMRPLAELGLAQELDEAHALHGRIANALAFHAIPEAERSPFMRAAIDDALAVAGSVSARRARPLHAPRDLASLFLFAGLTLFLSLVEVPRYTIVEPPARLPPLLLHPDDIEAFERGLDVVRDDPALDEEVRQAARELNQLLEDLADRKLDRTEALRELSAIDDRWMQGREASAEEMRESLRQLSVELERAESTRAAAEAMREGDAARAARAMRDLARELRESAPSRAELDRLRAALERAAERRPQDRSAELRRRREQVERLLQRQREAQANASPEERRLLERRQRELQRLEREEERSAARQRQLERLQREMRSAAESLRDRANEAGREEASESLERSAEELNRMAREQMSEEERQALRERLNELRELMQRQRGGQNGEGSDQGQGQGQGGRMERFVLRARGQGQPGDARLMMPGGQGQPGQGQQAQGQPGQGQPGQGQQGQGQGQQGPGQRGQGSGQGQGAGQGDQRTFTLGQGQPGQGGAQATIDLPGMGQQGQGQGQSERGQGGSRAGTQHDPNTHGAPTSLEGTRRNVRVEGQAESAGPTRSEVILSAAERGFANGDYQRVYVDYEQHAEEVLEQDEVPGGYRFYVRRYFQLIRPREAP